MAHGDSTSRSPLKIDIVERCRVEQRLDLCAAVARRLRHHRPPERGHGGTSGTSRTRSRARLWTRCGSGLEHFPEKWTPVFRRKCDQIRNPERFPIQPNRKALAAEWPAATIGGPVRRTEVHRRTSTAVLTCGYPREGIAAGPEPR